MNVIPFPHARLPFAPRVNAKLPVKSLDELLSQPSPTPPPAAARPPAASRVLFMHVGDKPPEKQLTLEAIVSAMPPPPGKPSKPDKPASFAKGLDAIESLSGFLPPKQVKVVRSLMRGEEGQFFIDKMIELAAVVKDMPATYGQRDLGNEAIIHLHYFVGGCDWWIFEKDKGHPKDGAEDFQAQAYGFANLNDPMCAEVGYISLPEIIAAGAELDFHWSPKTLGEIKAKIGA